MARFSETKSGSNQTTNYEGAKAYKLPKKVELYSAVCTASLQHKFYEKEGDQIERIRTLVKSVPHEFTAKLAVYARENMYLRSIPIVLAVELAKTHKGDSLVSKVVERVIQRADELYEILAYYQIANSRKGSKKLNKISNQLKLGIANAFDKFDEYQFAKYDRDTEIKLKDVMFLTHPTPAKGKKRLYTKIADGKLESPYTWETQLSEKGNTKEVWEELIDSKKVGYMATLRNLRNIFKAKVSDAHLQKVCAYISNEKAVGYSRQLPFRFLSAYREIAGSTGWNIQEVEIALEKAMTLSAGNIKGYDSDTKVVIACDMSSSMQTPLSPKSTVQQYEVGLVLGSTLYSKCAKTQIGLFGEDFKLFNYPKESILRNASQFSQLVGVVGHSTNGWKVLDWASRTKLEVDKFMFFTDCQWWDSSSGFYGADRKASSFWMGYKNQFPNAKAYYFDLAGYGNTPISTMGNDVYFIAGWSNDIFKILDAIENGSSAVKEIEKIEL